MKTRKLTILTMAIWGVVLAVSAIIFITLSIARGVGMGNNFLFGMGIGHSNRSDFVVVKEESFLYMNSFNLEWVEGNVTILPTSEDAIKIVQKANKNINERQLFTSKPFYSMPNQEHESNKLTITDGRVHNRKFFNSNWWKMSNDATDIEIYLPQRIYKQIIIGGVSCDINVTDVSASKFSVDNVSGSVYGNVTANNINFTSVSGDIRINVGRTENGHIKVDTDNVSGDVEMSFDMLPTNIDTNSISGDVSLLLPESNFTAELDSVSGNIRLNNISNGHGGKKNITGGDGYCKIDADSVSGDLSISVK